MRRLIGKTGRKQSGFSLIEILVSFLVLAVGLLGVASMQKKGVESNHSAYLRTQAVSLARDMANRVRANKRALSTGAYNLTEPRAVAGCQSTGCSANDLAANDLYEWTETLETVLPLGQGIVCRDSTPDDGVDADNHACDGGGSNLAVKIWWDARPRDGEVDQRYTVAVGVWEEFGD